ncbi:putative bifunctional diguanylate cyclase/phosphodiesterase [Hydrogenophaga defluvii]
MEPSLVSFFNPRDVLSARERTRIMVLVGGMLVMGNGLGWALFFLSAQNWYVAALEGALALVGLAIYRLQKAGHSRFASCLLFSTVFLVICVFSLILDVPTVAAPRTSHLWLLTVGLCAYYVLYEEKPWLRYSVASIYFAAFYVFASTHFGFRTEYAMPDSTRVVGTWINAAGAMLVMYLTLYLMNTDPSLRGGLHSAMRDALAARQFRLFYQPQVDETGHVVGAEALMRWDRPGVGMVSPAEFIPLAEQTGFILSLGGWGLMDACNRLAKWQHSEHLAHLTLSVNVSAQQIRQPDFVDLVRTVLALSGAPAKKLKLELTESMLVQDMEDLITTMNSLADLGVGIALDDFGTGYSSLAYIKRLPLRQLKIDQSFVRDIAGDKHSAAIARTLIALGQTLGLTVVAEGVETAQQRALLLREGCRVFQGYLFARPMEVEAFEQFILNAGKGPHESV